MMKMGLPKIDKNATVGLMNSSKQLAKVLNSIEKNIGFAIDNQNKLEKKLITIQENQAYQEKYLIAICKKLGIEEIE